MTASISYRDLVTEVLETKQFTGELYAYAVNIAINRFENQRGNVSEKELLQFIQTIFEIADAKHRETVTLEEQKKLSDSCLLQVTVLKAENLAVKDIDGSSDPYCLVSVVPTSQYVDLKSGKYPTKQTKIIYSNLNPEWNEDFEIRLTKEELDNSRFQLQVWDYDGQTRNKKKIRGIKGITRYMHETILSVSGDNQLEDDFMGFKSIKLKNIPDEGMETWMKCKSAYPLQQVSGQVQVRLALTSCRTDSSSQTYSSDLLYAGLLRKILSKSYEDFKKGNTDSVCWNCAFSSPAEVLLREFDRQSRLSQPTLGFVMWETYADMHIKNFPGIESVVFQQILSGLKVGKNEEENSIDSTRISSSMFCISVQTFIQEECGKIARHQEAFDTSKENHVANITNLLDILKYLGGAEFYDKIRILNPSVEYDVRVSVQYALQNGSSDYYTSLHATHVQSAQEKSCDTCGSDAVTGDMDVEGMIRLTEVLNADLLRGKRCYADAFQRTFNIDYVTCVGEVFHKRLAQATHDVMIKTNDVLYKHEGFAECKSLKDKLSSLFRLHKILNQFRELTNCHCDSTTNDETDDANREEVTEFNLSETDAPLALTHQAHRMWFLPVVFKWVQLCKEENQKILEQAVKLDPVKRIDDIVKHSSSAVDAVACLTGMVTTWDNWDWHDPQDTYTIAMWLTDEVARSSETYAGLVYMKLKNVGFFDDVGQFDVTEELCIALNNLHYVKRFLMELHSTMKFEEIADEVEEAPGELNREYVLQKLNSLVSRAGKRMEEKIKIVTTEVSTKMKPDIRKHLSNFAQNIIQNKADSRKKDINDSEVLTKLKEIADEARGPLMKYLERNLVILHEWLSMYNFDICLEALWKTVVKSMHDVVLGEFVKHGPHFFYQCRYVLEDLLDFFHEDGNGLSLNEMKKSDDYKAVDTEFRLRSASTSDLVKLFYLQMYKKQDKFVSNPCYGLLNVLAWYDTEEERVYVDVISASDLNPLDLNGSSDPFVQLRLAPPMLFKDQPVHQTGVKKKTLDPLWNEEFSFKISRSVAEEEGNVVIFAVFDYDIIATNELEGEAVLPLAVLIDRIKDAGENGKVDKAFQLPLNPMKKPGNFFQNLIKRQENTCVEDTNSIDDDDDASSSSSSDTEVDGLYEMNLDIVPSVGPLQLLRARRHSDKDAEAFLKSRQKFKKGKKNHS